MPPRPAAAVRSVAPGTGSVALGRAAPRLPSGRPELDALLGGGWPAEGLTEIAGRGRTTLGLDAVRAAQRSGLPVAWVDGTHTFCPATARVDLARVALVQPTAEDHEPAQADEATRRLATGASARPAAGALPPWGTRSPPTARALFAADTLLRSRAFGLLVLDMPAGTTTPAVWFRLGRMAALAKTALLLLQGGSRPQSGSAAGLVLGVRLLPSPPPRWGEPPPPRVEVSVLRDRAGPGGRRVLLDPR